MKKPSLAETQQWVKSKVHPSGALSATLVDLNPQAGTPGQERLSVYAEGYEIRFRDGLAEVYEAVRWVIGEVHFSELSKAYSAKYPSHNYNLSFVGEHLPEFIESYSLTKELPFLPDLAKLEWLICEAFHAFDRTPLDVTSLSQISPESMSQAVFIFQPSVSWINSSWPILDIWNSRKGSKDQSNIRIKDNPQSVMVYRHEFRVECKLLNGWQTLMLEGLLGGLDLESACEKVADHFAEELHSATEWFSQLMQDGLIAQIKL